MPATVEAPVAERGHAGVGPHGYLSLYHASIDQVVDLTWPTAVRVYDRMQASDSKVASSIRAMFLPILGAQWRVNPRLARDEVVERFADDIGLPIANEEDRPLARTRDRFSWSFHLRQALLSRIYGFMPFEMVFRPPDAEGFFRLRKLAPRMPHTLTARGLRIAQDGGLEGIEQQPAPRRPGQSANGRGPVFIPVDNLVMYVHERVGYDWWGQSILRSVYRDWLLKDTYHRIAAIGIDRHGAGVPIYTDAPPDEQDPAAAKAEAVAGQKLAEGYRVGENAGGRIPHGASFELKGVEGELPDILAYVRYHDEQIAANTLEMFSSLPSAPNGSRALGTALIDFFTLALNGHAADLADVTTNHVAEDWVDFNYGPEEPAPAVECATIGADQKLTAEALGRLIQYGAIKPDATLRRYLRRYYRLPDPVDDDAEGTEEETEPEPTPEPAADPTSDAPVITAAGDA